MVSRRSILAPAVLLASSLAAPGSAQAQFAEPYKLVDLAAAYLWRPSPARIAHRYVEYQARAPSPVYFFASAELGLAPTADETGLWRTDGTRQGTFFVAAFTDIAEMAVVNGKLLISGILGRDDGPRALVLRRLRP